jgi:hypothetical protein
MESDDINCFSLANPPLSAMTMGTTQLLKQLSARELSEV